MADRYNNKPNATSLLLQPAASGFTLNQIAGNSLLMPVSQKEIESFVQEPEEVNSTIDSVGKTIADSQDDVNEPKACAVFNSSENSSEFLLLQLILARPAQNYRITGSTSYAPPLGIGPTNPFEVINQTNPSETGNVNVNPPSFLNTSTYQTQEVQMAPEMPISNMQVPYYDPTNGTQNVENINQVQSPWKPNISSNIQPGISQNSNVMVPTMSSNIYRPVTKHWFYCQLIESKSVWFPFSLLDSLSLEEAFLSGQNVVATDGGRYDVTLSDLIRRPIYWDEQHPAIVRRCSWFYKGDGERYIPYIESHSQILEVGPSQDILGDCRTRTMKVDRPVKPEEVNSTIDSVGKTIADSQDDVNEPKACAVFNSSENSSEFFTSPTHASQSFQNVTDYNCHPSFSDSFAQSADNMNPSYVESPNMVNRESAILETSNVDPKSMLPFQRPAQNYRITGSTSYAPPLGIGPTNPFEVINQTNPSETGNVNVNPPSFLNTSTYQTQEVQMAPEMPISNMQVPYYDPTNGTQNVENINQVQSPWKPNISSNIQPGISQNSNVMVPTMSSNIYRPVTKHWFYCQLIESKSVWFPFSLLDSLSLEEAFLSGQNVVATDGGRYDVTLSDLIRRPIYWDEQHPAIVRRCSWFYKGDGERYIPYIESHSQILEDAYKTCLTTNTWHKQIDLVDHTVTIHNQKVIVHSQSFKQLDEWGSATNVPVRNRAVRRGIDDFDNVEDGESTQIDHLVFVVHGIGPVCDLKFRDVIECVNDFRSISLTMVQSHFSNAQFEGKVGRVEFLPVKWHCTLHGDATGIDQ
ncbi:SEC23-interacting protein [Nymphon striatum]|nr:SEC23-interacting protein [Nymphon striatum]